MFTVPKTLVSILMLMASQRREGDGGSGLARCEDMTYPEKQARQAWAARREKANLEVGRGRNKI